MPTRLRKSLFIIPVQLAVHQKNADVSAIMLLALHDEDWETSFYAPTIAISLQSSPNHKIMEKSYIFWTLYRIYGVGLQRYRCYRSKKKVYLFLFKLKL